MSPTLRRMFIIRCSQFVLPLGKVGILHYFTAVFLLIEN